ncbi:hypothetical protein [Nocardioides convexus]|uniref:hypothetical protein n=1 Tax=Nocardioides convexus TaxID=2712224 RepID=UPI00241875B8|nr:hypothetical protein [Nocardioides convexus]
MAKYLLLKHYHRRLRPGAGPRRRRADGPVGARGGRRPRAVHARLGRRHALAR